MHCSSYYDCLTRRIDDELPLETGALDLASLANNMADFRRNEISVQNIINFLLELRLINSAFFKFLVLCGADRMDDSLLPIPSFSGNTIIGRMPISKQIFVRILYKTLKKYP